MAKFDFIFLNWLDDLIHMQQPLPLLTFAPGGSSGPFWSLREIIITVTELSMKIPSGADFHLTHSRLYLEVWRQVIGGARRLSKKLIKSLESEMSAAVGRW